MSSTVIVGRRAACFTAPAGTFWALFETTYESNVHPHTPHESCVAFGSASQVMARVLRSLGACAGGMIRQRRRPFTPEGYLRSWLTELKAPRELEDRAIHLDISDRHRAAIPAGESGAFALRALRDHGYHDHAAALEAGDPVSLQLHADAPVIAAIYGANADRSNIAAWRVIKPDYRSLARTDFAMTMPRPRAEIDPLAVYDTGLGGTGADAICVAKNAEGEWVISPMHVVIESICSVQAAGREIAAAGEGLSMVQAVLPRLKEALPSIPGAAEITFDLSRIHDDYVADFSCHVGPACSSMDGSTRFTLPAERISSLSSSAARLCGQLAYRASVVMPPEACAAVSTCEFTGDLFAAAA